MAIFACTAGVTIVGPIRSPLEDESETDTEVKKTEEVETEKRELSACEKHNRELAKLARQNYT